jgi:hypothetical protein
MMNFKNACAVAAVALSIPLVAVGPSEAAPLAAGSAMTPLTHQAMSDQSPLVIQVQGHRGGRPGGGGNWHGGGGRPGGGGGRPPGGGGNWHGGGGHWHGGGWGYGPGWGVGAGLAAGALLGGALAAGASPYYYDDGPVYDTGPGYADDDSVAYCMQRFRSYDPASGTYLGYDGQRHPCP